MMLDKVTIAHSAMRIASSLPRTFAIEIYASAAMPTTFTAGVMKTLVASLIHSFDEINDAICGLNEKYIWLKTLKKLLPIIVLEATSSLKLRINRTCEAMGEP